MHIFELKQHSSTVIINIMKDDLRPSSSDDFDTLSNEINNLKSKKNILIHDNQMDSEEKESKIHEIDELLKTDICNNLVLKELQYHNNISNAQQNYDKSIEDGDPEEIRSSLEILNQSKENAASSRYLNWCNKDISIFPEYSSVFSNNSPINGGQF